MEGDHAHIRNRHLRLVSIHALAWRATNTDFSKLAGIEVSIHALAWRATTGGIMTDDQAVFQSTPSHGGRPPATNDQHIMSAFQSTPSHGGRPLRSTAIEPVAGFQSTPSHGGRLHSVKAIPACACVSIHALAWRATANTQLTSAAVTSFNPRPRMEGDPHVAGRPRRRHVSIHALAWRATMRS